MQNAQAEKDIFSKISNSSISREDLSRLSQAVAAAKKAGLQVFDWHLKGTPPFEQFFIEAIAPYSHSLSVQDLLANETISGLEIFRKGIPKPDIFKVVLQIENSVKAQ